MKKSNKRYYLDKLGCKERPECWEELPVEKHKKTWKKQRKKYGFDEREIWNLDYTWHLWLYEHLMMFLDKGLVNGSEALYEYKGTLYTQEEIILKIIRRLELELGPDYTWNHDEAKVEYVGEIEALWILIFRTLWY